MEFIVTDFASLVFCIFTGQFGQMTGAINRKSPTIKIENFDKNIGWAKKKKKKKKVKLIYNIYKRLFGRHMIETQDIGGLFFRGGEEDLRGI